MQDQVSDAPLSLNIYIILPIAYQVALRAIKQDHMKKTLTLRRKQNLKAEVA